VVARGLHVGASACTGAPDRRALLVTALIAPRASSSSGEPGLNSGDDTHSAHVGTIRPFRCLTQRALMAQPAVGNARPGTTLLFVLAPGTLHCWKFAGSWRLGQDRDGGLSWLAGLRALRRRGPYRRFGAMRVRVEDTNHEGFGHYSVTSDSCTQHVIPFPVSAAHVTAVSDSERSLITAMVVVKKMGRGPKSNNFRILILRPWHRQ
jgi:hypothetical protein